ncbi:WD40 repeat-like protein [Rickenella mellea]|uniref:WD40 repeat-like protein n=1 Tax=Rickenella mellea TaxID=50990 RepID=A0A4Y7PI65_9AGAM|nr:WD40 repeat-like protein [Rickenella mellea]
MPTTMPTGSKVHSVTSKLASKLPSSSNEKLKSACSAVVEGLKITLAIAKDVSGSLGVPGLQAGISGLLFVMDVVKKTSRNTQDVEELSKHIDSLNNILRIARDGGSLQPAIVARINKFSKTCSATTMDVRKIACSSVMKRIINYDSDSQEMSDHIRTMTWSIQSFTVETTLAIEYALDEHIHFAKEVGIRIEGKLEDVGKKVEQINAKLDFQDGNPPRAVLARFDCKDRAKCLGGTRTAILDEIYSWIGVKKFRSRNGTAPDKLPKDPVGRPIFWINGSAGTGKTTIAFTVAERCRRYGILGASFFCSRDDADCSNPKLIFPTIAYQLGQLCPAFKVQVAQAMKSHPDIGYSSLSYQLEKLIVEPLRSVRTSFHASAIVLDALDECKDNDTTSTILSALSLHVSGLSKLKILVTSRPERRITTAFQSGNLHPITQRVVLHELHLGVVKADIKRYLKSNLAAICCYYDLKSVWPSLEDIHRLVDLSFGLFIFAATTVKFIEDPNYSDPTNQLACLLHGTIRDTEKSSSPYRHLDQLYAQVLTHAFPDISSNLAARLKRVLGSIIHLQNPLSPPALEQLLGLRTTTVRQTLLNLHSVIIVPENDSHVIRLLHPSFFDFITDPTRCPNPKFVVNTKTQHALIARACLFTMKCLKRDMCEIKNPSILNSEIHDLPTRIARHVPPHLQYACRHWAFHFERGMVSDYLLDLVKEFSEKYLLYWLEVCSLLGELRNALLALNTVKQSLSTVTLPVQQTISISDAVRLLDDCEHFTREFFPVLSISSLQIYHSGLLLTPRQTLLHSTYGPELLCPVKIHNALESTWSSCNRTMEGHVSNVTAVAFSPDGMHIVSASSDQTVRMWDTVSGSHLNTFQGRSIAESVAFSPNGMYIVCGFYDKTLQLWDVATGAHLTTLVGHKDSVRSVAFSPDNTRVVSGSGDRTLRLWNALSGDHLKTLTGHSSMVISVAFSKDGTRIMSGSEDRTVQVWDAITGAHLKTIRLHSGSVAPLAFSPDGTQIASGSWDSTIQIWDSVTGSYLRTLKGHTGGGVVLSVAFSPDGTRLVSGSTDETLRLWDAISGAHLSTLKGHSHGVLSVSFSPDGMHVVSGSSDNTVRLWDAVTGSPIKRPDRHSDHKLLVAFSPDGTRIVSGSKDVVVWDAVTGARSKRLKRVSSLVLSLAFSPDGTQVVAGCADHTLHLLDIVNGVHLKTLKGHCSRVHSVVYSPDGARIASGSLDNTIRLWDAVTGSHFKTIRMRRSGPVTSLAFSPDGMRIVSASGFAFNRCVRMWDVVTGVQLSMFELESVIDIFSVAFSPDGKRIVCGSSDHCLWVWDAISWTQLLEIKGHRSSVHSVAYSLKLDPPSLDDERLVGSDVQVAGLIPCYIVQHGWIYAVNWKQRICWIPPSCRPIDLAVSGNSVALGTHDGRVVILDFTGMDSYLQPLISSNSSRTS